MNSSNQQQNEAPGLETILDIEQRAQFAQLVGAICARMRFELTNTFEETLIDVGGAGGSPSPLESPQTPTQFAGFDGLDGGRPQQQARRSTPRQATTANSSPGLSRIQGKCVDSFDKWSNAVLARVMAVCNSQKECTWTPSQPGSLVDERFPIETAAEDLRKTYSPIHTQLASLPLDRRSAILGSLLLILLSLEHYDARSRTLLLITSASLLLPISILLRHEAATAATLLKAAEAAMTAEAESKKRIDDNKVSKRWKVGLASVGGAVLIGITGGLAAPLVAAGVGSLLGGLGLGATAAAGLLGAITGSSAIVGALFGAYGGRMTGEMVERYAAEVEDFAFVPMQEHQRNPSAQDNKLRVTIGISGWLNETEDIVRPWRCLSSDTTELYALRWEMESLLDLGASMEATFTSIGWSVVQYEILKRTVLATLYMALWPIALLKAARLIDNPYSIGRHRSEKAGKVLADALMNHVQGFRPVNLVGYGLGARVIYFCLLELAKRGGCGLVQDVYLLGAPVPTGNVRIWKAIRAVAAGRVVNGYSSNDWILGFLERGSTMGEGVAGLQGIAGVSGIENIDLAKGEEGERIVEGHLRYGEVMGLVLRECDAGSLGDLDLGEVKFEENVLKELRIKEENAKKVQMKQREQPAKKNAPSANSLEMNAIGNQQNRQQAMPHQSHPLDEPLIPSSSKSASEPFFQNATKPQASRPPPISNQSDSLLDLMSLNELSFSSNPTSPAISTPSLMDSLMDSPLPAFTQTIPEKAVEQRTLPLRTVNARPVPSKTKTAPAPMREMHSISNPLGMMEAEPISEEPVSQKAEPVKQQKYSSMMQESTPMDEPEPIGQKYNSFMPQESSSEAGSSQKYSSFMPQQESSLEPPMPIQRSKSEPKSIGDWVQEEEDVDDVMDRVERALAAKRKARQAGKGGRR